jgi:hypothetical protein
MELNREDIGIDFLTKLTWLVQYGNKHLIIHHAGVHLSGGTPLRKNHAGIGYTYDEDKDAFIPKKPFTQLGIK